MEKEAQRFTQGLGIKRSLCGTADSRGARKLTFHRYRVQQQRSDQGCCQQPGDVFGHKNHIESIADEYYGCVSIPLSYAVCRWTPRRMCLRILLNMVSHHEPGTPGYWPRPREAWRDSMRSRRRG